MQYPRARFTIAQGPDRFSVWLNGQIHRFPSYLQARDFAKTKGLNPAQVLTRDEEEEHAHLA